MSALFRRLCSFVGFLVVAISSSAAQQTVFSVPSADVLTRGEIYGELDVTTRPVTFLFTAEPRIVAGVGHNLELGINLTGLVAPGNAPKMLQPAAKWKLHEWKVRGWSVLAGDTLFFALRGGSYETGSYLYVVAAKRWRSGTRVTAGGFDFTRGVVADANRAGVQLTFEQPLSPRVQIAAEWVSGDHTAGYLSPGLIVKVNPRATLYAAYQVGNHGVSRGNHNLLAELGYRFRSPR